MGDRLYLALWYGSAAVALGCFIYAAVRLAKDGEAIDVPKWRRVAAICAFVTVTFQALIFTSMLWAPNFVVDGVVPLMRPALIACVVLVFAAKGSARWWLLGSSVLWYLVLNSMVDV
jgi:hypothetical protein